MLNFSVAYIFLDFLAFMAGFEFYAVLAAAFVPVRSLSFLFTILYTVRREAVLPDWFVRF